MIIVTGGAGFIGSAMIQRLNDAGREDILVVDHMGEGPKWKNLAKLRFARIIHKDEIWSWLDEVAPLEKIDAVIHMGASSSTTVTDVDYLVGNNLNYTIELWNWCTAFDVPFIYASSAATYGDGSHGFVDDPETHRKVAPLNPYGFSKHRFDEWALQQERAPSFWAGIKFFNVYGPNEYHKGKQTSVIYQFLPQVQKDGVIRLFKSEKDGCCDGDQQRDFVYVKDCVNFMNHLLETKPKPGLYNCGTGKARTFNDLAKAVFAAMDISPAKIEYIDMPQALRGQYQYFTEADHQRIKNQAGYTSEFTSIEDGVNEYVREYLLAEDPFL